MCTRFKIKISSHNLIRCMIQRFSTCTPWHFQYKGVSTHLRTNKKSQWARWCSAMLCDRSVLWLLLPKCLKLQFLGVPSQIYYVTLVTKTLLLWMVTGLYYPRKILELHHILENGKPIPSACSLPKIPPETNPLSPQSIACSKSPTAPGKQLYCYVYFWRPVPVAA
jgi:hypothetical protein